MDFSISTFINDEIHFKEIKNKIIKNSDLTKTIMRNSFIKECTFCDVNLQNCDFVSTKIYSTDFNNVNFNNADLFSLWFFGCKFTNIDFTGASIEDITFVNCSFNNCIFEEVSLKNCIFREVLFEKIEPISCVFSLNHYHYCNFIECSFSGSFHYQIFENCHFKDVNMNSSVLKYNYGLGDLSGIHFIDKLDYCEKNLKDILIQECFSKKLFINAVVVDYNFSKEINPELAIQSIKAINKMVQSDILLQNEELIFLRQMYHFLFIKKLIAPIVLYKLFEEIKKIYIETYTNNISYQKAKDNLYMIANSLYMDFCDFCENIKKQTSEIDNYTLPLYVKICYNEEPLIPLSNILNQCLPNTFNRKATQKGSFIEFLEIGQKGLDVLNIFLQLLGIGIPIIYSEIKDKQKKKIPEAIVKKDVEINISNIKDHKAMSELIQQTCKIINESDLLTNNQQGYNNSNIKEINVHYQINIQA